MSTVADLPLDAYTVTLEELLTVHDATWTLAARCATRFGVDHPEAPEPDASVVIGMNPRRYGISSVREAAQSGYRPDRATAANASIPEWSPTRAQVVVLTGLQPDETALPRDHRPHDDQGAPLPDGGCLGEASRRLTGGARIDRLLVEQLARASFDKAESDPLVRAAWGDWSTCMARRGYEYTSPWTPNDADWGDALTEAERETATADALCRESTGLASTWAAVEARYQLRLIDEHKGELDALAAAVRDRIEAAHKVLGAAPQTPSAG